MNILPKKSWHVLSKKNIERVRRDEAQARAEEEEKAHRAAMADQESRLCGMRKRARERDGEEDEGGWEGGRGKGRGKGRGRGRGREGESKRQRRKECSVTDASGHINFFTDLQKGVGLQVGNAEREKEMKQEQEKLEKRIGLLNYLVDKDKSSTEPWYVRSGRKEAESSEMKSKSAKAEHRKELLDPLLSMKQYVEVKKKSEDLPLKGSTSELRSHNAPSQRHQDERSSLECSGSDKHKGGKHKRKQHPKDHDKKQKRGSEDLERLRKERKRREEGERARAEALIRGLEGRGGGGRGGESGPVAVEQVHGRYNSQFNPHLARQQ